MTACCRIEEGEVEGELTPGEPSPPPEGTMNDVVRFSARTPWRRSRGCYAQRRLMLGAAAPPCVLGAGRRFVPTAAPEPWTQPGRERPHAARHGADSHRFQGIAHVPAAYVCDPVSSARERAVHSTRESRPVSTAIVVTQSASLSSGERLPVSA